MTGRTACAFLFVVLVTLGGCGPKPLPAETACRLGAYALADGTYASVVGAKSGPDDLVLVRSGGEIIHLIGQGDRTYAAPQRVKVTFGDCASLHLTYAPSGSNTIEGRRLPLSVTDTQFVSDGVKLHGKLVRPAAVPADALVVWVSGSDDDTATDNVVWQYELARRGIAVFVYDKRGTGRSEGAASADFLVRAHDTVAALAEARRLAPGVRRAGLFGGSQGGWAAPLAASMTQVDFVIPAYAMVEGVTAQERYVVEGEVRRAGFGDDAVAEARQITDASAVVVKSGWKDGWERFDALKARYAKAPWRKAITRRGYTGIMLQTPSWLARLIAPRLDRHTSFAYDPRPVVDALAVDQLWILGGADFTTPSAPQVAILKTLQAQRSNIKVVVFPRAGHGLAEPAGGGATRYPDGLFDLVAAWVARGEIPSLPADVTVLRGAARKPPELASRTRSARGAGF